MCDRPLSVSDLFEDLQDGTVLYGLLEVLSKQSLAVLGRVKPERNKIKKIANMNIVWKYLGNTVKLVGIGPTDIVDGNVTLVREMSVVEMGEGFFFFFAVLSGPRPLKIL